MKRKICECLLDLLFPRRCPICDDIVSGKGMLICVSCKRKIKYVTEPYCKKCGKGLTDNEKEFCFDCSQHSVNYDAGRALYEYNTIQESVYRFKYMGRREYASFYGQQIAEQLREQFREWKVEALVPVPMYKSKKRRRGYNQAEELAGAIGKCLKLPVYANLVSRIRCTTPQKKLSRSERQNNLKKAFKICADDVKLGVVVVIDDIYTTGSTIDEIAKELKRAGVVQVYFITLAIGNGL